MSLVGRTFHRCVFVEIFRSVSSSSPFSPCVPCSLDPLISSRGLPSNPVPPPTAVDDYKKILLPRRSLPQLLHTPSLCSTPTPSSLGVAVWHMGIRHGGHGWGGASGGGHLYHCITIPSWISSGGDVPASSFPTVEEDCRGSFHGGLQDVDLVLHRQLPEPERDAQRYVALNWSITSI